MPDRAKTQPSPSVLAGALGPGLRFPQRSSEHQRLRPPAAVWRSYGRFRPRGWSRRSRTGTGTGTRTGEYRDRPSDRREPPEIEPRGPSRVDTSLTPILRAHAAGARRAPITTAWALRLRQSSCRRARPFKPARSSRTRRTRSSRTSGRAPVAAAQSSPSTRGPRATTTRGTRAKAVPPARRLVHAPLA
jgi:hypothetical protein